MVSNDDAWKYVDCYCQVAKLCTRMSRDCPNYIWYRLNHGNRRFSTQIAIYRDNVKMVKTLLFDARIDINAEARP